MCSSDLKTVGTVKSRAGRLSHGPQTGNGRGPFQIGPDAAAEIVGAGHHGDRLLRDVDVGEVVANFEHRRQALHDRVDAEVRQVEQHAAVDAATLGDHTVLIGLSAAVVSVAAERPRVLVVHRAGHGDALPFGTVDPIAHRTLESGLRDWVQEQTGLQLGYVEQLYTFGDRGRHMTRPGEGPRVLSVGYLALTRPQEGLGAPETVWRDWYAYFPWEDWREKKPAIIESTILPHLAAFVSAAPNAELRDRRRDRMRVCFGADGAGWDEEKVLERYELLYEAGLVREAQRDRHSSPEIGRAHV